MKPSDAHRQLALLRASSGKERASLLREPPRLPTRVQSAALKRVAEAGGRLPAEAVHFRVGLVLTARRWLRLCRTGDGLAFELTAAGKDVLVRHGGEEEPREIANGD